MSKRKSPVKGQKSGDSQRKAVESPDSLFSIANARIIDLVSEGEIYGFPHGDDFLRDVYFDETPVQNPDGTKNFKNFQVEARTGTQTQDYIPGFPAVENEVSVNVELKYSMPWTRSFTNRTLSAVRVRLGVGAFSKTNDENGDVTGTSVRYAIDVSTDGGPFVMVSSSAFTGKTTSGYQRGHRIELPPSSVSGWTIRVRRLTADSTTQYLQNKTSVISVTEIIDGKFRYPMSAVVGTQIDASQFQSVPTRAFDLMGRIIKVPANYDPEARTYATSGPGTSGGAWDGTFKMAYSNNPAWVFYDLTTHDRYGLGHLVDPLLIDKWSLYGIGQYCDETVNDGFGGTEPRMTCNLYIQSAADAWKVMGDLCSVFRGICYWAGGSIVPVADRPADAVYTYTNANVIDGQFKYQSTARKTRHTAVTVSWNDMTDFGRRKTDYYDNPEGIARYGLQVADVVAVGCTSRGQAQRLANWILYSSSLLTNVVEFGVGPDGTYAAPGQIVRIADKHRAGRRTGGRMAAATPQSVTVDVMPDPAPMIGDTLIALLPSGVTESRTISSITGNTINVSAAFTEVPATQGVWAVEFSNLKSQLFRVLGVGKGEGSTYSITCSQHNPSIFDAVDFGQEIKVPEITQIPSASQARPSAVTITSVERAGTVVASPLLTANWDAPAGAVRYQIQWRKDNGSWTTVQEVTGTTADLETQFPGFYEAKVQAVNVLGVVSGPTISIPYELSDQTKKPTVITDIETNVQINFDAIADEEQARLLLDQKIADESLDRQTADAQVAADAAADAANKAATAANNVKTELQAEIAVVRAQVGDILQADVHTSTKAYPANDLVQSGNPAKLYRALQAVPVGIAITNTAYWEEIGNYASLGEAVAATAALSTTTANDLEAVSETVDLHDARMPTGTGKLATDARVTSVESAAATARDALGQRIGSVEVRMPTGTGELATASALQVERARITDNDGDIEAVGQRVGAVEVRLPAGSGQLASSASVTAVDNASVTRDNALGQRTSVIEGRMPAGTGKLGTDARITSVEQAAAAANAATADRATIIEARLNTVGSIINPSFEQDMTGWNTSAGGFSIGAVPGASYRGSKYLRIAPATVDRSIENDALIEYRPDRKVRITAQTTSAGAPEAGVTIRVGFRIYDNDMNTLGFVYPPWKTTGGGTWTYPNGEIGGEVDLSYVPAGTAFLRPRIYVDAFANGGMVLDAIELSVESLSDRANAASIDAVSLAVQQQDDFLQATADDLEALETEVHNPTTGLSTRAGQTDFSALKSRADTVGGGIESMASRLSGVEADVDGKADSGAFNALDAYTRTTLAGEVQANATNISGVRASLGGKGVNLVPLEYSYFPTLDTPPIAPSSSMNYVLVSDFYSPTPVGGYSLRTVQAPTSTLNSYIHLGTAIDDYNIAVEPGKKYRASMYYQSNVYKSAQMVYRGKEDGVYRGGDIVGMEAGGWHRYSTDFVIPAGITAISLMIYPNKNRTDAAAWAAHMCGIMFEEVIGDGTEPSTFAAGQGGSAAGVTAAATQTMRADVDSLTGVVNASWTVLLDVNGYVTGVKSENNGTEGTFTVLANNFRIVSPGQTPKVPFAVQSGNVYINTDLYMGNGRIVSQGGGYMKVQGSGFGVGNEFLEWYGPQMSISSCSRTNAVYYFTNGGDAYFGGTLSAGILKNAAESTTQFGSSVLVGPFSTNGGTKIVNWSMSHAESANDNNTNIGNGAAGSCSLELWRKIGTGAWSKVSGPITVNFTKFSEVGAGGKYIVSFSGSGGSTYTDTNTSTAEFSYEVRRTTAIPSSGITSGNRQVSTRITCISTED